MKAFPVFADHLPWLPNPVPFPHSWYRSCAVSVGYGVHWLRLDCSQVFSVSLMVGSCTMIPYSCYNVGADLGSLRTRIMGCFWLDPAYFWWCEWLPFNPGETLVQPCSLPELNCWVSQPGLFFRDPFTPQPSNNPGHYPVDGHVCRLSSCMAQDTCAKCMSCCIACAF